ncbi:hypothetical protein AB0K11_02260 [Mycobacterium sp. NPDC050551]|uniref:WXG100 family type VII secretion target n=1 Tax=Mycobacterium sp. NPDC050551 TaxID=3155407 RepID=UPI0034280D36
MSPGIAAVLGSKPEALITAAGQIVESVSNVDVQIAGGRTQFADLDSKWTGTAAEAAQVSGEEMIGDQVIYRDKLSALEKQLNHYGASLRDIRKELSDLVSSGEAGYFDISDDGTVTPGWRLLAWGALSARNAMEVNIRRLQLQTKIQTALDKFDAADKAAAGAIRTANRN